MTPDELAAEQVWLQAEERAVTELRSEYGRRLTAYSRRLARYKRLRAEIEERRWASCDHELETWSQGTTHYERCLVPGCSYAREYSSDD